MINDTPRLSSERVGVIALGAVGVVLLFLAIFTLAQLTGEYHPVDYGAEFTTDADRYLVGDTMIIRREYCNTGGELLVGSAGSVFRPVPAPEVYDSVLAYTGVAIFDPGCHVNTYRVRVPELEPGTYEIIGSVLVLAENNFQQIGFRTTPFEVIGE